MSFGAEHARSKPGLGCERPRSVPCTHWRDQRFVMARLEVQLLGFPSWRLDGRGVDLALRKGLRLISYLADARAPVGRDHMAGLLWPDADANAARGRLRRTLHKISAAIAADVIDADRGSLALAPSIEARIDAHAFEAAALPETWTRRRGSMPETSWRACRSTGARPSSCAASARADDGRLGVSPNGGNCGFPRRRPPSLVYDAQVWRRRTAFRVGLSWQRVYLGQPQISLSAAVGRGVFANKESVNHLGNARHKCRSPVS
jgi:hypothetical protein